jgi:hypothetical protein
MSPAEELRVVTQILSSYGLEGIEPHIPDLAALMLIDVTHQEYIEPELLFYVAAAASEALTARSMSIRNEARACLAMTARCAAQAPALGRPRRPSRRRTKALRPVAPRCPARPTGHWHRRVKSEIHRPDNHQAGRHPTYSPAWTEHLVNS